MNLDDLRGAARQVPFRSPSPALRDALRAALVEAASLAPPAARRRRSRTGTGLALLAAAAGLALWLSPGVRASLFDAATQSALDAGRPRATVDAETGAEVEHTQKLRNGPGEIGVDEVVRVRAGRVAIRVEPRRPSERVRVVVGEVEVHVLAVALAASLHVAVEHDRLIEIRVEAGQVALHFPDRPSIELHPQSSWRAPEQAAAQSPEPPAFRAQPGAADSAIARATARPTRRAAPSAEVRAEVRAEAPPREQVTPVEGEPPPLPAGPATASEQAFGQGFRALRGGDHLEAARRFSRAIAHDPRGPLAVDARFWRAVALGRAGRAAESRRALVDFLARHPDSARSGTASVMLGWLLLEAGDRDAAAGRFRAAAGDRDPEVRASAAKGLAAARGRAPSAHP
jgi:TolA-binding protein